VVKGGGENKQRRAKRRVRRIGAGPVMIKPIRSVGVDGQRREKASRVKPANARGTLYRNQSQKKETNHLGSKNGPYCTDRTPHPTHEAACQQISTGSETTQQLRMMGKDRDTSMENCKKKSGWGVVFELKRG